MCGGRKVRPPEHGVGQEDGDKVSIFSICFAGGGGVLFISSEKSKVIEVEKRGEFFLTFLVRKWLKLRT